MSPNTFESEWAQRWRALEEMEAAQKEALDKQFKEAREKLQGEMEQAIQEHEAVLMRQGTDLMVKTTKQHFYYPFSAQFILLREYQVEMFHF